MSRLTSWLRSIKPAQTRWLFVVLSLAVLSTTWSPLSPAQPPSSGQSPAASTPREGTAASPSRLYEAVSGYWEGMRGKGKAVGAYPVGQKKEQRRDHAVIAAPDDEPLRLLVREQDLARHRMERGEWDLAVPPLRRAVAAAGNQHQDQVSDLRSMIQLASGRTAAAGAAASTPVRGEFTNSQGMRLVGIPAGSFTMGTSAAEIRRLRAEWSVDEDTVKPETPSHSVRITRPFFIGKYEVTVGQFTKFVEETGHRTVAENQGWGWVYSDDKKHWVKQSGASWRHPGFKVWEDHPASMLCHADAEAYCAWLSKKEGRRYFLPTEAQWEYAARGGRSEERYPWGNQYPDARKLNFADFRSPMPWADRTIDDGHGSAAPVGSYETNGYRLYDMMGNVWEWCSDYYDPKSYETAGDSGVADPTGPKAGKKRVIRGGNWAFGGGIARNAFRFGLDADQCIDLCGFRVAAALEPGETIPDDNKPDSAVSVASQEDMNRLMDRVRDLAGEGRWYKARKVVEQLDRSGGSTNGKPVDPKGFVKDALSAVIDLTHDKSAAAFTNTLGMKMIRIPPGAFVMGSSESDIAWALNSLAQNQPISLENEFPFHKVRISRPFCMSATEVTVAQFQAFVEDTGYVTDAEDQKGGQTFNSKDNRFERKDGTSWRNPGWTVTPDQPVTMVSYDDAQAFVEWLSAREKLPYRLPTEAQWEYACRGGQSMVHFPWGDGLPDGKRANFADQNTDFEWRDRDADDGYKYVAPVGTYAANGYGLFDMAGNALEWVRDYYGEDYFRYSPEIDPEGPGHGENRVTKGGEWTYGAVNLRCAFRGWSRPDLPFNNTGFRVIIDTENPLKQFYFASDFLTREWVPGSDQREVAVAVAKEQERRRQASRTQPKPGESAGRLTDPPVHRGVAILAFTPKSDAKRMGLAKGDVIIEYNGVSDLTAESFLALTAETRKQNANPVLVIVREGYRYSLRVPRGFLGITIMDMSIRGPFKEPKPQPETDPDGTDKGKAKPKDWT